MNADIFCHPPSIYRSAPFWSWNDDLRNDELERQARDMGERGWGGYFMHSRVGLVIVLMLINLPIIVWMLYTYFREIPGEILEAARMDGAGPMRFFWDILLPLSRTSIAALFVIQFIYGWNQYLWPLLVTTKEDMYPVVLGIRRLISGDAYTEWNVVMATAILAMLPPALVVILMQKWFVKGLVDTEK